MDAGFEDARSSSERSSDSVAEATVPCAGSTGASLEGILEVPTPVSAAGVQPPASGAVAGEAAQLGPDEEEEQQTAALAVPVASHPAAATLEVPADQATSPRPSAALTPAAEAASSLSPATAAAAAEEAPAVMYSHLLGSRAVSHEDGPLATAGASSSHLVPADEAAMSAAADTATVTSMGADVAGDTGGSVTPLQMLGSALASSTRLLQTDSAGSSEAGGNRLQSFTIEHLKASWGMMVLRVFHAWAFLMAAVVIAGIGINVILRLFVQFFNDTAEAGKTLQGTDKWQVLALCTTALLLSLFFAGLIERALWLLSDSFKADMFLSYRRTLCCEGSGPGTFKKDDEEVRVQTPMELAQLRLCLDRRSCLTRSLVIGGRHVEERSQLLARGDLEDQARGQDRREMIGVLDLPATLWFRAEKRPASFHRDRCRAWRARVDICFQWCIFATLDIFPILWASSSLRMSSMVALSWKNGFLDGIVLAACSHVGVYYVWSTIMEYRDKVTTMLKLLAIRWPVSEDDIENVLGADARAVLGAHRSSTDQDSVNACVCARNCLLTLRCRCALCICGVLGGLVAALLQWKARPAHESPWLDEERSIYFWPFCLGAVVLIGLWLRFTCLSWRWQAFIPDVLGLQLPGDDALALWFQVQCGVHPPSVALKAAIYCASAALLIALGSYLGEAVMILVACVFFAYSGAVVLCALLKPSELWMLMTFQTLALCLLATVPAAKINGWQALVGTLALVLLTQLGMTRQRKNKSKVVIVALFIAVFLMVGSVTFMATATANGFSFDAKSFEFCGPNDAQCEDFTFPLHGSDPYAFCGLSWPMGPNSSAPASDAAGTVSDKCEDHRLSLVDFAHLSSLAYHLPNKTGDAIAKYFPGWIVLRATSYVPQEGKFTTFLHVARGETDVIAIRGTYSAREALQDLNLWMPAAFLQIASTLGPSIVNMRNILNVTTQVTRMHGATAKEPIKDVLNYAKEVKEKGGGERRFYVTGHSLGGGLAQMIGALVQIPAITFSAPGMESTSVILDPPADVNIISRLRREGINVMPDGDLVPQVDEQTGTSVQIDCDKDPLSCHGLDSTMCELMATCGDGGGRAVPRGYAMRCDLCEKSQRSTSECSSEGKQQRSFGVTK